MESKDKEVTKAACANDCVAGLKNLQLFRVKEDDEMKIYLKVITTIALGINSSDTVGDLKVKFRETTGISEKQQELFSAGKQLKDGTELAKCGIQNGSTLRMFLHPQAPMKIHIKRTQVPDKISLDVNKWDTIQNVKAKIQQEYVHEFLTGELALFYGGKKLEDTKTLAAYGIENGSILRSLEIMKIFVYLPTGEDIELEVKEWYTIKNIKAMVENILDVQVIQLRLTHDGKPLKDGRKLSDCNIGSGSTLHLLENDVGVEILAGVAPIHGCAKSHCT